MLNVDGNFASVDRDYFAELFQLPNEGISSFADISATEIHEVQTLVSATDKPFKISDTKTSMKFEYQILIDIVAKGVLAKA